MRKQNVVRTTYYAGSRWPHSTDVAQSSQLADTVLAFTATLNR